MFASLKHEKSVLRKYFFVLFLFHRSTFIFAVFWLEGLPFVQLGLVALSTLLMLVYFSMLRPFKAKSDNFLNIFNTSYLLGLYCFGFLFTSPLVDSHSHTLGLSLVIGIFSILGLNLAIILVLKIR